MDNSLLASIRGFNKSALAEAETVDKSASAVAGRVLGDDSVTQPTPKKRAGDSGSASAAGGGAGSRAGGVGGVGGRHHPPPQFQPPQLQQPPQPQQPQEEKAVVVRKEKKKRKKSKRSGSRAGGRSGRRASRVEMRDLNDEEALQTMSDPTRVTALDIIHEQGVDALDKRPDPLMWLVFLLSMLAAADLSIMFPSLHRYVLDAGGTYWNYGAILTSYNAGQILGAPLFGYLSDHRHVKQVLLMCSSLLLTGNCVFLFNHESLSHMLIGRILAGLGSSCVIMAYSHITKATRPGEQRDSKITLFGWAVTSAQVIAPAVGILGVDMKGDTVLGVAMSRYTFPALVMASLFGMFMLVQLLHLVLTRRDEADPYTRYYNIESDDVDQGQLSFGSNRLMHRDSFTLLFIFFAIVFVYWTFVSAVFPFTRDEFEFSAGESYMMFLLFGAVVMLAFGVFKLFHAEMDDTKLVSVSLVLVALGSILCFPFGSTTAVWQIFVAGALINTGFCFASVLIPAMFGQMAGVQVENLGLRMSWFFATVSLARCFGPLLGAGMIEHDSHTLSLVALLQTATVLIVLLVSVFVPLSRAVHGKSSAATTLEQRLM
eukprot:TRINITY_DN66966_c2_g1_i1.p1 TRINITY_DN66966_c2_g1~~TRINITY_DN66966_c2_g1_i1.p1  ORF type:complete len:616 (+),score=247.39 TRINITY_DN66966_c2_g1_i1:52-1848(+)